MGTENADVVPWSANTLRTEFKSSKLYYKNKRGRAHFCKYAKPENQISNIGLFSPSTNSSILHPSYYEICCQDIRHKGVGEKTQVKIYKIS